MFQESESTLADIGNYLQRTARINKIRRNAIQFIDSDQPVPDDDLMLRIGINTLDQFPPLTPVAVAYQELVSAGQMQLIRSPTLRKDIAVFHASLELYNQLSVRLAGESDGFWRAYKRRVSWNYNPESETSDILLSIYNWETIRGDENFIIEAIGKLRNQLVIEESLIELKRVAMNMCQSIGTAIGRSCQNP